MTYTKTTDLILRVAVAFAFLYPPFNAFSQPEAWVGYFPAFMAGLGDPVLVLHIFGIVEIGIALWILSGWKIWLPSLAAAAMLVSIVAFNSSEFQVLFRDLPIAAAALVLAITRWPNKTI
jgi:uncharacterized membrane protein YphA (DoxX/SURF4 family)